MFDDINHLGDQHSMDNHMANNHMMDSSHYGSDWLSDLSQLKHWSANDVWSPWQEQSHQNDHVVGSLDHDAQTWHQQGTDFTCAVVSQEMILRGFGVDVSEAQLVYDAVTHGWLTDHGTFPQDIGNLLELHGVACHQTIGSDVESLAAELAQGHQVIVAVDSDELWSNSIFEQLKDQFLSGAADHAVVVTGLDMSDPSHPQVRINDPGDPGGAGKAYPLDQFLDSWQDSGNFYVATDHAPNDLVTHSIFGQNFSADANMYMDLPYWTNFLANLVADGATAIRDFALNNDLWTNPSHAAAGAMVSPWLELDDTARNSLFADI